MASQVISLNKRGLFRYHALDFDKTGQDSYSGQDPEMFERLTNVMPVTRGALERRWGYGLFSTPGIGPVRRMGEYQNDLTGTRYLLLANTGAIQRIDENGLNGNVFMTPSAGALVPRWVVSRDWAYFVTGVQADLKKWNPSQSSTPYKWGITAPATAPSVGASSAGSITLTKGRKYYLVFRCSWTEHCSDLSPVSASTGAITAKNIPLTNLEVSSDPQVDRKLVLATKDGEDETTLYLLADIPNAQTSLTDNVPEETLLFRDIYLETDGSGTEYGVTDNTPPPNGAFPTKHAGRIVMVVDGQYLRCSKNLGELVTSTGTTCGRYEECWPAEYEIDISNGAEMARGLLSDGSTLFVGTEKHIRRILGDSVENFTAPEIAFNSVGLLNNDVWKVVYLEGTPMGMMWLTPDYKVIGSDFNTYNDAGQPIQDVLNTINPAVAYKAFAMSVFDAPYSMYCLFIPTGGNTECDTVCVFDLKTKTWFVWYLANTASAGLLNVTANGAIQPLFASSWHHASATGDTNIYKLGSEYTTDSGGAISVSIRTSWLHMGDPSLRKLLNEIEVMTGNSNLLVTVEGASTTAEFDNPSTVIANTPLVTSPFGEYKVYLAGSVSKDRFYRFTFSVSSAANATVLDSYSVEAAALHHL